MVEGNQQMNMRFSSRDDRIFDSVVNGIGFIILLVVLIPIIFIVSASFSDPTMISRGQVFLLPKGFTLEGYNKIFEYKPIWIGYRNTLFYTVAGTMINLLVTIPCAYALSRKDFLGRNFVMLMFTFTMFFSGGLIPTYLLVKDLGIINTVFAMLLPNAASVWFLIISRTYFQSSIPDELREAAFIDGSTNLRFFLTIVLPLSKPIIAVMTLFYAVGHWNAFFNALIYLSDFNLYPLQLFLRNILILDQMVDLVSMGDQESQEYMLRLLELKESMKFGIIMVSSLPVLIIYPFVQKYFVKGVMIGAIKM